MDLKQHRPSATNTETVTRPLRTAKIGRLNHTTSGDATAY